jgi:hypothetical protein
MTPEARDYRVLQRLEEQDFVVFEAVSGRLLPEHYASHSAALWRCVVLKEAWAAECRAAARAAHPGLFPADT